MKKRVIVTIVLVIILCCTAAAEATLSGDSDCIIAYKKGVSLDNTTAGIDIWGRPYYLAGISNGLEQQYIESSLHGFYSKFGMDGDQDRSNNWSWVKNKPWSYCGWAKGKPYDYYGPDSGQLFSIWSGHGVHTCDRDPVVPIPSAMWLLGSGLTILGGLRLVKWRVF